VSAAASPEKVSVFPPTRAPVTVSEWKLASPLRNESPLGPTTDEVDSLWIPDALTDSSRTTQRQHGIRIVDQAQIGGANIRRALGPDLTRDDRGKRFRC
jgi:hypothetical protein